MTKFKTLIILATLLAFSPAYSWEPAYWVGAGGVLTNYKGDFLNTTTSQTKWPFNLGGTIAGGVNLGLSDSLGLYTQASWTYNKVDILDMNNPAERGKKGTQLSMASIDLSPMLRFYINGISPNLYIGLGFSASLLTKCSKQNFDGSTTDTEGNEVRTSEAFATSQNCLNQNIQPNQPSNFYGPWLLNRLKYGVTAGIGFGYKSDDDMYISLDCTYIYNLNPTIFKEAVTGKILKAQNIVLLVNIGIPI